MSALERERDKTEEKEVSSFDSNSISPGTKFMDHLTKYVEWYIRKRVTESWAFEVIFSNEKVCGEGEHKCYQFIRKFGVPTETYCIHGMDADLIMLSMGTQLPSFWILREEPNRRDVEFYAIDVADARRELVEMMRWQGKDYTYDDRSAINDFIFMCFTVGNDFLPHIPAIEIIQNGIEFMLDVYKNTGSAYGHLTETTTSGLRFRKKALAVFLGTVSQYEKGVLEDKLTQKDKFFPDTLLERYASVKEGKWELDLESYRNAYYREKVGISEEKLEKFSHEYLEGMQWVLTYYSQGVPSWTWKFPYHYAPFSSTITKYVESFSFRDYAPSNPSTPFFQLLSILPPKSASLLPAPLNSLLASPESPLAPYCPEKVEVDLSGKRQSWEGVVLLPMIDQALVKGVYNEKVEKVEERERGRDKLGQSFTYRRGPRKYMYKSFYGDFVAITEVKPIQL